MTELDPRTSRVIRDLAKTQHDLKRQVARLNRGQDAGRTTIHHGALEVADEQGNVTHRLGETGLAPVAGPKPPRPAAPALIPGQAQIVVATDGDDFEGNSAPVDWAKTRVYATTQPPLDAAPGNVKGTITEVAGETTIGVHAGVWHVGIVWVTDSGQVSDLSEVVTVEVDAPVDTLDLEDTLDAAEQIINDAVAVAQQQIDTLKTRLDNFEEFDPSELEQQLANVSQGLVDARQEAANLFESLEGEITPQALITKLVAQEAWIGGTLLKNGAVEAEHVTASESLSAKIAEFLKLSVVDLVAGTGQIDDAVIEQLWVDGLVALSATLARAIIAAPNLLANGDLRDGQGWWPSQLTLITDDTPPGYKHALRTNPGQGTLNVAAESPHIPLEPGQDYMFEMWIKADLPGSVFFWDMRDQNGTHIGSGDGASTEAIEPETGHSPGTRPVSSFNVPTEWARIRTRITTGSDMEYAYMAGMYFNHAAGSERQAVITFGGVKVTSMTDGSLIVDDSIYTRHLHVAEDMVGRFAEFLHLVVDRIDVNQLWADQTWQNAGYFGAETANLQNRTDGRGMEVTAANQDDPDGPRQTLMQVGVFGDNSWVSLDPDTGETLSSIGTDGAASFQMIDSATDPTVAGRRLVGGLMDHPASQYSQGLLDSIGWVEVAHVPHIPDQGPHAAGEVGFLQVNFMAFPGRQYQITAEAGHINRNGSTIAVRLRYNTDGLDPDVGSTLLEQVAIGGPAGTFHPVTVTGRLKGSTDIENGRPIPVRLLLSVSSSTAWQFVGGSGYRNLSISVHDVGPIRPASGYARNVRSTTGGTPPGVTQYQSVWWPSSFANYYLNGTARRYAGGTADHYIMQGYDPLNTHLQRQGALIWFNQVAHRGEVGSTLPAAMAGADLESGSLDVYGEYMPGHLSKRAIVYWHEHTTAPSGLVVAQMHLIAEFHVPNGGRGRIQLPRECLDAIENNTFKGFGFYSTDTSQRYALGMSWKHRPNLILNYQR